MSERQIKSRAKKISKSVVCSNLTKTAVAGHDANLGKDSLCDGICRRFICTGAGRSLLESAAGTIQILPMGVALPYSEEKATEILSEEKVKILADLKLGDGKATAWGCDLTHGYIDINADYRS